MTINKRTAHIWTLCIDRIKPIKKDLFTVLSSDEQERALRFKFEEHSTSYTVTRASLRLLLARYLQKIPEKLNIEYSLHGKPSLKKIDSGEFVCFNVSHSADYGQIAITKSTPVGIDIECCHPKRPLDYMKLAERFFSPREYTNLRELPESERLHAFYRCWTCKEAYIKAVGLGLALQLDTFSVNFLDDRDLQITVNHKQGTKVLREWSLFDISNIEDYQSAIATDSSITELLHFELDPGSLEKAVEGS
ncbi:MAG: 4'-phosphopantetheinyl transferase superfamily protein [Verrucomicrobiota bacterium]